MHRAEDTRVVVPHEHLGEEFNVPVLLPLLRILLRQRGQVVLDVRMVLARGYHAVALDDPAFLVELIAMIQDPPKQNLILVLQIRH